MISLFLVLITSPFNSVDVSQAKKATVVVFVSPDCPCSQSHEAELSRLSSLYSEKGFRFVGVSHQYFEKSRLPFSVLTDSDSKIADEFAALKTPHVFVVDPQGKMLYRGAVTDSTKLPKAKKFYLATALEQIDKGQKVELAETKSLGCAIERN